jgi:uncharacterized protein with HEPN domain
MRHDTAYLLDILHASKSIMQFTEGLTEEAFYKSGLHQSAVIRQLEIIGEAAKKISEETRTAHSNIPWKKMAGLRDVLIHAYDTVDVRMVWRLLREDLPQLITSLEKIVQ